MAILLKLFGAVTEAMSPFCREFSSQEEFMCAYMAYYPTAFSWDGQDVIVDDQEEIKECVHEIEKRRKQMDAHQVSCVFNCFKELT
jgi:hypothetical protein